MPLHVITGGPGSGKSTLIDALSAAGYRTVPEAGRAVIRGGDALPWRDPDAFATAMEAAERCTLERSDIGEGIIFLDRGLPDIVGYRRLSGLPVADDLLADCRALRYADPIFIAPPWADIYAQDEERRQDYAEAVRTHDTMRSVYSDLGYRLAPLPRASIAERVGFVLAQIRG